MKTIKIIGLTLLVAVFAGNVNAQSVSNAKRTDPVQDGVKKKEWPDDKKLRSFFASGEIPSDFPSEDKSLTGEENKQRAIAWAKVPANFELLSDEGKKKYNELINEK